MHDSTRTQRFAVTKIKNILCNRSNPRIAILISNAGDVSPGSGETVRNRFEQWAVVCLRMVVGFGFVMHGYAKLTNGPGHFVSNLQVLGVPAPELMGWATIIVELLGGLALMIGAYVSVVSLPLAAILLVAAFTVHLQFGFSSIKLQEVTTEGIQFGQPGVELDLLYLASLAVMVLCGPGRLSVDRYRLANKKSNGHPAGGQH